MPLLTLAFVALARPTGAGPVPTVKLPFTVTSKVIEGVRPLSFASSPDGSKFAMTLENNEVRIVNSATHQTIRKLVGHTQPAYSVAWSPDGNFIATGDESARIIFWNALTGARIRTVLGHIRGVSKLSFSSTGAYLISTGNDDVVNVWNAITGKKVATLLGKGLNEYGASFSPKADNIIVGLLSGTGGAKIYRMTPDGPKFINFFTYTNPSSQPHGVFDVSYSPDAKHAVTAGNDGQAIVWDTFTFKKVGILKGHDDFVRKVAFSPNGKLIATSSSDRTVRIWDAVTLQPLAKLDNECATSSPLAFTADGKYLLSVSVDDSLQLNALSPTQGATAVKPAKPVKKWVRKGRK